MKYIYDLISEQKARFRTPIPITEEWEWSFYDHVNTTIHYKNSIFKKGPSETKPFKNIFRPLLNLQYRAEGFDVKDIVLFIEDSDQYFKSLLIKKFHDKWARENDLDTFIDQLVESYVDFGGVLVKTTSKKIPEVVPLQRLAFCDQSNMLGGPICEQHFYSPTELRQVAKGKKWENVEIAIAQSEKQRDAGRRKVNTPAKYIEVYELHGTFPKYCLKDDRGDYVDGKENDDSDENELIGQIHICTFYKDENNESQGITLFRGIEREFPFRVLLRDEIYGRALGLGGGEELFQDQIWTNYGMIRMKELLDAASKVLFKTTDPTFANRNKTTSLENGEILVLEDGKDIQQIDTTPRSTALFDRFVQELDIHAQKMSGATEAMFGMTPPSDTPFKSLELQVAEAHSLHEYRKGKLATFLVGIYRDKIIPNIVEEITAGTEFLASLDLDELRQVADGLVLTETNRILKEAILRGELIFPEGADTVKKSIRDSFLKGDNKRFIKVLQKEFAGVPVDVEVNIAGKQKDLAGKTDKLVNIMRFVLSTFNPQTQQFAIFQDSRMIKLFNNIIESSGLNPIDFASSPTEFLPPAPQIPLAAVNPLQKLATKPTIAEQLISQNG